MPIEFVAISKIGKSGSLGYSGKQELKTFVEFLAEKIIINSPRDRKVRTLFSASTNVHYFCSAKNYIFICLTSSEYSIEKAHAFLADLETEFNFLLRNLLNNIEYPPEQRVNNIITREICRYNRNKTTTTTTTGSIMVPENNIMMIADASTNVQHYILSENTELLDSTEFVLSGDSTSAALTRKKYRKIFFCVIAFLLCLITLIVVVIIAVACGFPSLDRCK